MNISEINKSNIDKIEFKSINPVEYPERRNQSFRLKESDYKLLPEEQNRRQADLRIKIIELFEEKLDNKFTNVEEVCDIERSLFSKYVKGRTNLSKSSIIKFALGLKLSPEETLEMLSMNGTALDYDCRFDYICMCAIRDKDELEDLNDELISHGCIGIIKERE